MTLSPAHLHFHLNNLRPRDAGIYLKVRASLGGTMALRAEIRSLASQLSTFPLPPPLSITGIFQSPTLGATALSPLSELPGQPCRPEIST